MKKPTHLSRGECLRAFFQRQANDLLFRIRRPLTESVTVTDSNAINQIEITLRPLGDSAAPAQRGRFFSPLERLIVDAIKKAHAADPDRVLIGKAVAGLVDMPFDGSFRSILSNLVAREVLKSRDEGGYRLATDEDQ